METPTEGELRTEHTATQKETIIAHLRAYGSLNPLQALADYGIYRLGARISELRSDGWEIETTMIRIKSKITGKDVAFASYKLKEKPAEPQQSKLF